MTAIATLSGRIIDFINPAPESIALEDLAAGLSRQPRYTGQTTRAYSVAQHSLLVASMVAPEHRLAALLHDAPEAYACDVASPMKEAMRVLAAMAGHSSPYDAIERGLFKAIARRYGIGPEIPGEVIEADRAAMRVEAPYLQPDGWRQPIWDFAREMKEPTISAKSSFLRVLGLDFGGRYAWMIEVAGEARVRVA